MARSTPLVSLHSLRHQYGPTIAKDKLRLLTLLESRPIRSPSSLARYHDDLLFLAAFPDNAEVRSAAERALARWEDRMPQASARDRLGDSGMSGSTTRGVLSATMVRILALRYPGSLDLDSGALGSGDALAPLLTRTLLRAEEDGFDAPGLTTRAWIRRAMAGRAGGILAWLMAQRPSRAPLAREWDTVFDEAEPAVAWTLPAPASATRLRLPFAPLAFRSGLRATPPPRSLARPLRDIVLLDPTMAEEAIHVARVALASRGREVHAITEANPGEVYLADLGQGVSLLVVGALPHARMALEANYGHLLLANGVPIGYGGVTPLGHQANTGVNIFPAFRRSEAGAIFGAALRAFATLFGVRRFIVNPYQFGRGNPEAIASGAYWFYHRLGFEATDPDLRLLATRERDRQKQEPGHRTDRSTLRRLAQGDLTLALPGSGRHPRVDERCLARWSLAAAGVIGREADGRSRAAALRRVVAATLARLGVSDVAEWSQGERRGAGDLAPVCALLPLERWTPEERRSLVRMIRAKGSVQERKFVLAAQTTPRFWRDLTRHASAALG